MSIHAQQHRVGFLYWLSTGRGVQRIGVCRFTSSTTTRFMVGKTAVKDWVQYYIDQHLHNWVGPLLWVAVGYLNIYVALYS